MKECLRDKQFATKAHIALFFIFHGIFLPHFQRLSPNGHPGRRILSCYTGSAFIALAGFLAVAAVFVFFAHCLTLPPLLAGLIKVCCEGFALHTALCCLPSISAPAKKLACEPFSPRDPHPHCDGCRLNREHRLIFLCLNQSPGLLSSIRMVHLMLSLAAGIYIIMWA